MNKARMLFIVGALAAPMIIVGCSTEQLAKLEVRIDAVKERALVLLKRVSAKFTSDSLALADKIPGNLGAAPLARIVKNNDDIQKADSVADVIKVYARGAAQAGDDLLKLAELVPGAAPYAEAIRTAVRLLRGFADHGMMEEPTTN